MKLSKLMQEELGFVERVLGDSVICQGCRATLATYSDACTADLQEPCQGFIAIENAKKKFVKANSTKEHGQ